MSTTTHINLTSILQKCVVAAAKDPRLENLAYGAILGKITYHKNQLLKSFDEHPITKEIRAGPGTDSQFLSVGNLFSFIGFYAHELDDPLREIKAVLNDKTRLRRKPINKIIKRHSVLTNFIIETPFLKDIWAVSQYPKGLGNIDRSGSWAEDIETRGIGGFEYYVYSFAFPEGKSRSTTGLQFEKKVRSGRFGSFPYIRNMLNIFRSKFGGTETTI